MNIKTVTVDVRDDIRGGHEPFSRIMHVAGALQADEQLLLIAPFEPLPLIRVLEKKGFRHAVQSNKPGDWEVLFVRPSDAPPADGASATLPHGDAVSDSSTTVEVDARGLEPPQPLVTILESLAALPAGAELRAWTDRRPIHLYAQLEERGFTAVTHEQPNGSFLTHIHRR